MTDIEFRSDFDVEFVDHLGTDLRVVQAARVSTEGADSLDTTESQGLINFLMRNRHGSPFEHCAITWMISAPIFVWREFMRHRIASYNEESGRYKQLKPVFYIPDVTRPATQTGKIGEYKFQQNAELMETPRTAARYIARSAYEEYEQNLRIGVAKEVARQLLPLNIYSTAYVTMNLRGLMNFLSLRTHETAQWEIRRVATQMQGTFAAYFPQVYNAWQDNGKVAP